MEYYQQKHKLDYHQVYSSLLRIHSATGISAKNKANNGTAAFFGWWVVGGFFRKKNFRKSSKKKFGKIRINMSKMANF